MNLVLRINPGTLKGSSLSMGGITQFGMPFESAMEIISRDKTLSHGNIIGIHVYAGTGILDHMVLLENVRHVFELSAKLQAATTSTLSFIDVGGGIGIPYYDRDQVFPWQQMYEPLQALTHEFLERSPKIDEIAFESGRFLVGPSGVFLTSVLDIKAIEGKTFVVLDGGTNVFGGVDRYLGARIPPIRVLCRRAVPVGPPTTLCGPLCTPTDRLAADVLLPSMEVGDIVAIYQAGAYSSTMGPGLFLSHGFAAEVVVDGDVPVLTRRRSSTADLLHNQLGV